MSTPKYLSSSQIIFYIAPTLLWSLLLLITPIIIYINIINSTILLEWELIYISSTPITFNLILDKTGLIFSWIVLFIRANVLSFSIIYINNDPSRNRFTILVLLFVLSINFLIYIPHIIILLLGWDGLGLTSFILVIYYQNKTSLAARIITALTNRIGDVAILLAIGITLNEANWLITHLHINSLLSTQIILIILAAITKSAQIPFSRWLPAAIAAPTPVSALVHSSTLVTAGVFLLIRFYPTLHILSYFNTTLLLISTSTTFIAGLRATIECDFKKIIALSTLRQLGIIIFSLGANIPWLAFFHISTHAIFKALLFICAGSIIHFHSHSQDLRWIGNITSQLPSITSCIIIANLALCGFPFTAGFYSKDLIIESASHFFINTPLLIISITRLALTSFYATRSILTPIRRPNNHMPFTNLYEPIKITTPTTLLASIAILAGSLLAWSYPLNNIRFNLSTSIKLIPTLCIITGLIIGWLLTSSLSPSTTYLLNYPLLHTATTKIWFLVPLSTQFLFKAPSHISLHSLKSIDQGWIELSSGQGILHSLLNYTNLIIKTSPLSPNHFLLIRSTLLFSILFSIII